LKQFTRIFTPNSIIASSRAVDRIGDQENFYLHAFTLDQIHSMTHGVVGTLIAIRRIVDYAQDFLSTHFLHITLKLSLLFVWPGNVNRSRNNRHSRFLPWDGALRRNWRIDRKRLRCQAASFLVWQSRSVDR
jgi:hypothetical protein